MSNIDREFLKKLHTKQLFNAMRKCCVSQEQLDYNFDVECDGSMDPEYAKSCGATTNKDEYYKKFVAPPEAFGYDPREGWTSEVTIADLKAELSIREHVPNKIEAKEIRRAKARAKRNR
jgi:hypothetical protein